MQRSALSLCLVLCAPAALAAAPAPVFNAPADVAAITALEMANASSTNMAQTAKTYMPGAVVYDLKFPNGTYHGRAEIAAGFGEKVLGLKSLTASVPDLNIITDGTMACAALQVHLDVTTLGGRNVALSLRQMDVLRKIHGQWLIEYGHISFPAYPTGGMADMDYSITKASPFGWSGAPFPGPRVPKHLALSQIAAWTRQIANAPSVTAFLQQVGPGDDELIYDTFALPPLRGQKMISDVYTPAFAPIAHSHATLRQFYDDSDGYLGAQLDMQNLAITLKDGSSITWVLRQSDCLHHVNGKWYSMYDEVSFPAVPALGRAVEAGY